MIDTSFLNSIISDIGNRASLDSEQSLVTISHRLTEKNAAMIDVLSELNQGKVPLHIFPGLLSFELAKMISGDETNAELLEQMIESGELKCLDEGTCKGALSILMEDGVLTIKSDLSWSDFVDEKKREAN